MLSAGLFFAQDAAHGSLEMTLVLILPVAVLLIGFIWRHHKSAGTNTHP
jgi:heme/copper-type cytochrome/quinol oxidase subunit 2